MRLKNFIKRPSNMHKRLSNTYLQMRRKNFLKRPSNMHKRIKKTAKWMKDIEKLLSITNTNIKKILSIVKTAVIIAVVMADALKIFVSSIT